MGTPASVPGLLLWLKASAGTNTTTNGAQITSWASQEGNGYSFVPGVGTGVTYQSAGINSLPAVTCDGASNLAGPASVAFPATGYSIWLVGKFPTATGTSGTLFAKGPSATNAAAQLYYGTNNLLRGTGSGFYLYSAVNDGNPHLFTYGLSVDSYGNGNEIGRRDTYNWNARTQVPMPAVSAAAPVTLFGDSANSSLLPAGFVLAEIGVYDHELLPSEIATLWLYAAGLYGMTLAGGTGTISPTPAPQSVTSASVSLQAGSGYVVGGGSQSYAWYRGTTNGTVGTAITGQVSQTLTDTGLSPNTTYYYRFQTKEQSSGNYAYGNQVRVTTLNASGSQVGPIAVSSVTSGSAALSVAAASGGTAPYAYQWYQSAATATLYNAGNAIAGATGLTYSATGLAANSVTYFGVTATDSAGTPTTGKSAPAAVSTAVLKLGFVGDSVTIRQGANGTPADEMARFLAKAGGLRTVSVVNRGTSGSTSGSWVSGSSYLSAAVAAFNAAGTAEVFIMLGANDANAANTVTTPATYQSNISSTITYLFANVPTLTRVWLNDPTWVYWDTASPPLCQQYQANLSALANGTTIRIGDTLGFTWFLNNQSELADGVHPNNQGVESLGVLWGEAYYNAALAPPGGVRRLGFAGGF